MVAKDFKLKNHKDLKKYSVLKEHLHQIDSKGWQKGPSPGADRVKLERSSARASRDYQFCLSAFIQFVSPIF